MQKEFRETGSHDELTGLFRRERFIEEVRRRLILNEDGPYVLAVSDIRSFKLVNDTCGRDTGDQVLVKIAEIIRKEAPPGVCYARLEADHFAGLFPMERLDAGRMDELLRTFRIGNREDDPPLFLHAGLYEIIDPAIPVPVMIDRARLAIAESAMNMKRG
ncbi:MAG: GGDEF domain-containing protein [Bulleidia sp.]